MAAPLQQFTDEPFLLRVGVKGRSYIFYDQDWAILQLADEIGVETSLGRLDSNERPGLLSRLRAQNSTVSSESIN